MFSWAGRTAFFGGMVNDCALVVDRYAKIGLCGKSTRKFLVGGIGTEGR